MVHEGHLLIILHAPPEAGEVERQGCLFWRTPAGEWRSTEKGGRLALKSHLDEFEKILRELEQLDDAATRSAEYFLILDRIAPLLRTANHQHQVLQEARKAVPDDRDLIIHRDRSYHILRTAELCQESVKNGLESALARKTEEQADAAHRMSVAAHRLNLLAGFFFPVLTLASIFGMGLLEIDPDYRVFVFAVLMIVGLLTGCILTWFLSASTKPD